MFKKLKNTLQTCGFSNSKSNTSLFYQHSENELTFLLIYIDDVVVTRSKPTYIDELILKLYQTFVLKDYGLLHSFLVIEVARIENCKGTSTSLKTEEILTEVKGEPF